MVNVNHKRKQIMAKEKLIGILYKVEQKAFGKKVDPLIDFRNLVSPDAKFWMKWLASLAEKKDSDVFTAAIKVLDDKFGEKIPVDLKPVARKIALAFLNDNHVSLEAEGTALLNMIIDIPGVTENTEALIIRGVLSGFIEAMKAAIKKKKK